MQNSRHARVPESEGCDRLRCTMDQQDSVEEAGTSRDTMALVESCCQRWRSQCAKQGHASGCFVNKDCKQIVYTAYRSSVSQSHRHSPSSKGDRSQVPKSPNWSSLPSVYSHHLLVLVLIAFAHCAGACSSRSTPKPRPPSHSAMRPNITFQTYACPPAYAAWYCLNGATCFTVKIADSILYNCECADGYMGQRCEFKDLDGTYLPTRERLFMGMGMLGKTSRVGPVFLAVFFIILALAVASVIYTKSRTKAKKARVMRHNNRQTDRSHHSPESGYSMDMSVLGQSISYTLSQQPCPTLLTDYHGISGLRNINRHDSRNLSSRIPKTYSK